MKFADEKEERIIKESAIIFKRFGIKSVNMDDIASKLGMSKKTLYKYVTDKNDLVKRAMQLQIDEECTILEEISAKNLNAIDESFEIMRMVMGMIKDLHPAVVFDIQKYHPELMRTMECKRSEVIATTLEQNMRKGVEEGLYRTDLIPEFITSLYVSAVEAIFHKLSFGNSDLSFQELYLELFRYHTRGIASDKGIALLKEKINQERQTN